MSSFEVLDDPIPTGQSGPNYDKGKGVKSSFFHHEKAYRTFRKVNGVKLILGIF